MRILIVEDEYYLASDLASAVRTQGWEVVGPVGTIEDAEREITGTPLDGAVLDVNLRGEMSLLIADRLDGAGIPYVIATGYSAESLPERFRDKPRLEKPFNPEAVVELMKPLQEVMS